MSGTTLMSEDGNWKVVFNRAHLKAIVVRSYVWGGSGQFGWNLHSEQKMEDDAAVVLEGSLRDIGYIDEPLS